jgi:hypothetical protein
MRLIGNADGSIPAAKPARVSLAALIPATPTPTAVDVNKAWRVVAAN